jgi:corrinoid protein of di/trimethylamine methyltransferase
VPCEELLREISAALASLDEVLVEELVAKALEAGCPPLEVVERGMRPGMEEVGRRFERGEYFLPELIVAADIFQGVLGRRVLPLLPRESRVLGRVVIGTVRGDIHDIGKNLVAAMLRASGFEVIDLGVDVPPERFVEAVREHKPDILGMSALLTTTMLEMRNVIDALRAAGLRDKVKVIVGGAPVTEEYAREIGADAYARDAVEAVRKCAELVGKA